MTESHSDADGGEAALTDRAGREPIVTLENRLSEVRAMKGEAGAELVDAWRLYRDLEGMEAALEAALRRLGAEG